MWKPVKHKWRVVLERRYLNCQRAYEIVGVTAQEVIKKAKIQLALEPSLVDDEPKYWTVIGLNRI